ncbi:hypothetical protein [Litoreibacter meonggei]|nr:hypothetical protein [Litoreibacter meonggei]
MEFATEFLSLFAAVLMVLPAMPFFKKIADVEMLDIGIGQAVRETNT